MLKNNLELLRNRSTVRKLAWIAWCSAAVFYLYEYFVRVAPGIMEEELLRSFGTTATALGLATGVYYTIYGPMQLIVGPLFDRFGARRLFILTSSLVFLGCFLCAIPSKTLLFFALGRFLMGTGSAFAFIGTMYVATVWFPHTKLAFISGLTTALGMVGALIGQAPLAKITSIFHWRGIWILAGILGIGCMLLIYLFVPRAPLWDIRQRRAHFDSGRHSLRSFLTGIRVVITNPQTWLVGIVGCTLFMPLIVFADFWGIRYIELVTGSTKAQASMLNGLLYLGWLVGSPLIGALSDYFHRRRIFLILSCFVCKLLLISILAFPQMTAFKFGTLLFLLGIFSSPEVICFIIGVEINPFFAKGTAIAMINMIIMLFGGLMQPLVGILLDLQRWFSGNSLLEYSSQDFRFALMILPISLFIGFILSLFIRESYGKQQKILEHPSAAKSAVTAFPSTH